MTILDETVLQYCKDIYGIRFEMFDRAGYRWYRIKVGRDVFTINSADKMRFGKYTIFHQNKSSSNDGKFYSHVQMKVKDLGFAFYICSTHELCKEEGISFHREDWFRFKDDAVRFCNKY